MQIDNETNPKIQTIYIDGFPIHTAHFTPDGQQIILSSRRKYFYVFDVTAGQVTKVPNIKGKTLNTFYFMTLRKFQCSRKYNGKRIFLTFI